MRRAFVLLVLLLTACEGSFVRPENLGRKVEINKSYEARDTCLKHQAVADGTAGVDPATQAHTAALTCQGETDGLIAAANTDGDRKTTSGCTQCTRDSLSGEPKRLSRGGGSASGIFGTCSGVRTPARRFSSLSVMPVPARPA